MTKITERGNKMVRTIQTILLSLVVMVLCGCNENQIGTTVLTGQDTDLTARVGYGGDGVEAGVVAKWTPSSDIAWGPEPDQVGLYVTVDATWILSAEDTPAFAPVPLLWLEQLDVTPYAGVEFVDDCDNGNFSNLQPNYIFGLRYTASEYENVAIVTEYVDGDQVSGDVLVGLQYRF